MARVSTSKPPERSALLAAAAEVPDHVVYRGFANETVVLNLQTGTYHGLNPTAGRMLEVLQREQRVRDAIVKLADEYGAEEAQIEQDVCEFCRDLLERGLIELHTNGHG